MAFDMDKVTASLRKHFEEVYNAGYQQGLLDGANTASATIKLSDLGLGIRPYRAIVRTCGKNGGDLTLKDLFNLGYDSVSAISNFGPKSFDKLIEKCDLKGVAVPPDWRQHYRESKHGV